MCACAYGEKKGKLDGRYIPCTRNPGGDPDKLAGPVSTAREWTR